MSTSPTKLIAEWQCQNSECNHRVSAAEMIRLHKELRSAKTNLDESTEFSDYKDFLEKHLGPCGLLHATSTYILQIKISLIFNILGHVPGYSLKGIIGL